MDLSSVLNNTNSAPEPKQSQPPQSSSPIAQRQSQPQAFPPPSGANGPSPSFSHHPSHQTTPQYAPPSQERRSPTSSLGFQSKGATPLHMPSHAGPGQYPFPQNASQSPVAAHPGQQYQSYAAHPSATPGSRPMSHGQPQPPTPSHLPPSGVPAGFNQYSSSHSPTPPSHPGQTPHSVRQSPLATFAHPPHPPPAQQYPYQHPSQPSTPLGPPSLQYQRTSGHGSHTELFSPNHQRNFSGASNGMVSGSPAQHHPSVGNLIDSPSAYNRQSPQMRRTSDYLSQGERDRSVSVSPKTKVVPRIPSHGSRHSSMNEGYGMRTSLQSNGPQPPDAQSHVQSPVAGRHMGVAQPSLMHSASDVSQTASQPSRTSHTDPPAQPNPQTAFFPNAAPPQHHSQKMGMNHLLTPSQENSQYDTVDAASRRQSIDQAARPGARAPQPHAELRQESGSHSLLQQPLHPAGMSNSDHDNKSMDSRKRPAEKQPSLEPPTKRGKSRKYTERPIWATLARNNPRFDGTNGPTGQTSRPPIRQQQSQHQQARATPQAPKAPLPQQQPNGSAQTNGVPNPAQPWLQPQPLDLDLIHARSILGPWEKTFKWNTPMPGLLKVVQDWFWQMLDQNADVGTDPSTGTIEIEAKVGTLVHSGQDERAQGPYMNMGVIHPSLNKDYRFESRMGEPEHEAMNKFLNSTAQASMANGRVHMQYEHLYQTDSFAALSPAGMNALPAVARRKPLHGREMRLRTTRNTKTNEVIARIIKVPLGDLHIQNPNDPYDCRISMNLEVNLDRPDLNPDDLVEPPSHDKPPAPERRKDRLSYKHLAYSIDLTKVESAGVPPKYELELEVDANLLRSQIARVRRGQDSAYGDVVSGFLDNATFLMRQAP